MKKRNLKERITLDPIMTLLVLIVLTIVISGFLSLLGVQVTYNTITDSVTFNYTQSLVSVESLFSLSGLKYIFTTTVSNFVSFKPLSSLIIILIGIGVMEKSGFLKTVITLLTKKAKKKTVTFWLVFICTLMAYWRKKRKKKKEGNNICCHGTTLFRCSSWPLNLFLQIF